MFSMLKMLNGALAREGHNATQRAKYRHKMIIRSPQSELQNKFTL